MGSSRLMATVMTIAAGLSACSTVSARIRAHKSDFDAYPVDVQAKIRREDVDLGFTPEQTEMALGRPDHVYTRKSEAGQREVWAYGGWASIGVGFGVGGGGTIYGAGFDAMPERMYDDHLRVVFEAGKVVAVEKRQK